jgi:type IV secretion system protein VirB2
MMERHKYNIAALLAGLAVAGPARAQEIDLSPVQNVLQGIVDALTGPLGLVLGTLALIGVFVTWLLGYIDFQRALYVVVAVVGVAAAPTIVGAIFGA